MKGTSNNRLLSLDALRGFDMLFIMGFATLVRSLCALVTGGTDCYLAQTMVHAEWDGLYHHDTIFPLFLFIAGVSFPYSYAKQCSSGVSQGKIYMKVLRRALILIGLGLVYNGFFKLDLEHLRLYSVLGRIGLAWALAAVLYMNFSVKSRAWISAAILLGYWLLVAYVPAPDAEGAAALSRDGNIVGYIDRTLLPGRLYSDKFDPLGLVSTLPAVVTAMLGMFAGDFVRKGGLSGVKTAGYMGLASVGLLVVGLLLSLVCPINKALWSSSFVLVVGAYSLALFALFYYIIDVKGWQKWAMPFVVIGMNSITIYMAKKIIPFARISGFFLGGFAGMLPDAWEKVVLDAGYVAIMWLFLYFLYRKKVFLKI